MSKLDDYKQNLQEFQKRKAQSQLNIANLHDSIEQSKRQLNQEERNIAEINGIIKYIQQLIFTTQQQQQKQDNPQSSIEDEV